MHMYWLNEAFKIVLPIIYKYVAENLKSFIFNPQVLEHKLFAAASNLTYQQYCSFYNNSYVL